MTMMMTIGGVYVVGGGRIVGRSLSFSVGQAANRGFIVSDDSRKRCDAFGNQAMLPAGVRCWAIGPIDVNV
jgi:hypothetical protein